MKKRVKNCIVCGVEYIYCNNCKEYASKPSWMAIYHDENCRNIMNIATEYMAGNITKGEAKEQLDLCDLKNRKNFKESVARAVDEICSVKKSPKKENEQAE